jgi:hypothetical protein
MLRATSSLRDVNSAGSVILGIALKTLKIFQEFIKEVEKHAP